MTELASRATVVLDTVPESDARLEEIALAVIDMYKPDTHEYTYMIVKDLPETLPTHEKDQLQAAKRDAGENAQYFVVWMK